MIYFEFHTLLKEFGVFSVRDITKQFPGFDKRRLVEWQQKGYISKLINKWYVFNNTPVNEFLLSKISNSLIRPSYISLQTALSFHGLIPEGVYSFTAVTTRKTTNYETGYGNFIYRTLKPQLYFGYHVDRANGLPVLMAEPEKAILDFLYLSATLNTVKDMEALRINSETFETIVNRQKLLSYAVCFESATLNRRLKLLIKSLHHANAF